MTDRPAVRLARRYLLFERFSFADPQAVRMWSRTWPTWRRRVRPVGATAFWISVLLNLVWPVSTPGPVRPLKALLTLTVLACVVIGITTYVRLGGRRVLSSRYGPGVQGPNDP